MIEEHVPSSARDCLADWVESDDFRAETELGNCRVDRPPDRVGSLALPEAL
jgi:hypothetical protein